MRRPAEEPGAPLEPSGNRRPREMVTPDRIRLRGLLRENPAMQGFPILGKRPRASPVHHDLRERALRDCPTRRNAVGQSAWLSQIPPPCLPMSACSERRLLNEQDDPAEPPSNQRDVRPSTEWVVRTRRDALLQLVPLRTRRGLSAALSLLVRSRSELGARRDNPSRAKHERRCSERVLAEPDWAGRAQPYASHRRRPEASVVRHRRPAARCSS
jgi:hypothetical protein